MKKIIKKNPKNNNGFSLLELLLAVVLLAIVITPLIQTFYTSMALNNKSRIQMGATNLGQSMMEYCESTDYTHIKDLLEHSSNISIAAIEYNATGRNLASSPIVTYTGETGDNLKVAKKGWSDKISSMANDNVTNNVSDKFIAYKDTDTYDFYTINSVKHNGYEYDMDIFVTPLFTGTTYKLYEVQIDVYYDDPKESSGKHYKPGHFMTSLKGSVYESLE